MSFIKVDIYEGTCASDIESLHTPKENVARIF